MLARRAEQGLEDVRPVGPDLVRDALVAGAAGATDKDSDLVGESLEAAGVDEERREVRQRGERGEGGRDVRVREKGGVVRGWL